MKLGQFATSEMHENETSQSESARMIYSSQLRMLVLIALLFTLVDFCYGLYITRFLDKNTSMLMSMNGMSAIISAPPWLFYFYYATQVFVLGILLAKVRFARSLFTFSVTLFSVTTLLFGIGISLPIGIFLATILAYLYGAILILLFLPTWTDGK